MVHKLSCILQWGFCFIILVQIKLLYFFLIVQCTFTSTWHHVSLFRKLRAHFSFHRCREKQRKEASRLQTVNRKLTAMNKLLMEENDRLQKQVSHLVYENGYMRQQLHTVS